MNGDCIHVLLVEDDSFDARQTCKTLSKSTKAEFLIDREETLSGAVARLQSQSYDVVLLDMGLPDGRGLELLERVRSVTKQTPIVVLSGLTDEATALQSLNEGAQDYICKDDLTPSSLERSILYAVQRFELVEELRMANDLLEQKNQRLAELYETAHQFVDNVSHEFRTPLTVIREFSSIMRDGLSGTISPQQERHLDSILNRTDDLALMVDDMLDISRLEAGLLRVWRRPCHVEDMLRNVSALLDRRASTKGIALEVAVEPDLPKVYCDDEKVRRVAINLVTNALKFVPEGGHIKLWARGEVEASQFVIGVTDDGPGIGGEYLEAIFERFKQIEGTVRSSTKGFGLGLSIAKELVALNLGTIGVESELGEGSTFFFTLPMARPRVLFDRYVSQFLRMAGRGEYVALFLVSTNRGAVEQSPVVDEFLQHELAGYDLAYPLGPCRWIVAAACPPCDSGRLVERLHEEWTEFKRNFPKGKLSTIAVEQLGAWRVGEQRRELTAAFEAAIQGVLGSTDGESAPPARKILVIDDDLEVVEGLKVRLEATGYLVITACDGEQGLALALEEHPDAIVLDIRMPKMDGMTTLRELKRNDATSNTPIVMLSASLRDQQNALDRGVNFFVSKPYEAQDVISALQASMELNITA